MTNPQLSESPMSSNTPIAGQNGVNTNETNTNTNISGNAPRAKICVFCGSSGGASPAHMEAARQLGRVMAENNIDLGRFCPYTEELFVDSKN